MAPATGCADHAGAVAPSLSRFVSWEKKEKPQRRLGRNRCKPHLCSAFSLWPGGETVTNHTFVAVCRWSIAFVGTQGSRKNLGSHIDASLSRQPLVKGERLVRYEVNAVMSLKSAFLRGLASVRLHLRWHRRRDANLRHLVQIAPQTRKTHLWEDLYIWVGPDGL